MEEEGELERRKRKRRRRRRRRRSRARAMRLLHHLLHAVSLHAEDGTRYTVLGLRGDTICSLSIASVYTYIYIYTYSRSDAGIPRICNVLPVFSITPFHHDFRKPCATYPVCAFLSVLSRYFFIGSLLYDSFLWNIYIYAKVFEHSLLKYRTINM